MFSRENREDSFLKAKTQATSESSAADCFIKLIAVLLTVKTYLPIQAVVRAERCRTFPKESFSISGISERFTNIPLSSFKRMSKSPYPAGTLF